MNIQINYRCFKGWINSINTEGIIKSLRDTSVPSELVDGLESILTMLPSYLDGSAYEDNYYDDYYYDDDAIYYNGMISID